jgi:hypothetical protein
LQTSPVALLSDAYSGDYIVVDSAATVQRLGCLDKSRKVLHVVGLSEELLWSPVEESCQSIVDLTGQIRTTSPVI